MRHDTAGFFWDDTPPPKVLKEKIKRTPPEPVWEREDYLPGLEEAIRYALHMAGDEELIQAAVDRTPFVFDVEVYPNFFCVTFTSTATGRSVAFELSEYETPDLRKLAWCYSHLRLIGFNSMKYDRVIMAMVLAGHSNENLRWATVQLIEEGEWPWKLMQRLKLKDPDGFDHIDLIEVCPLSASLKIYGGRLFAPLMQDLPFPPQTILSYEQQRIVKLYNYNDNKTTALIYSNLQEQIKLREVLSARYKTDLRSKSDAQVAEAIVGAEIKRLTGQKVQKPTIEPGFTFRYQTPHFIKFSTSLLQGALQQIQDALFVIDDAGYVGSAADFGKKKGMQLEIAGKLYTVGIGGLHSNEQSKFYFSNESYTLKDRDVISYYPYLMINSGKYPAQMPMMMRVYVPIIQERVRAKLAGDNVTADSLKIVGNGVFGKTGSPDSIFYAPEMMIQTTVTGQLSLLMLIERMELAGIHVVSANTDGITMQVPKLLEDTYLAIVQQWEKETGLGTEETIYDALYSRDVNNYLAVKPGGKVKGKGIFGNPWTDPKLAIFRFHKNPMHIICTEAVEAFLVHGVPLVDTVYACNDINRFTCIQKGGGNSDGVSYGGVYVEPDAEPLYLGRAVRWYYAKDSKGMIVRSHNGNMVSRTEGCRPLMSLPSELPEDLDRDWYVAEARSMLESFGLPPGIG